MKRATKEQISEAHKRLLSASRDYHTREFSVKTLHRYRTDSKLVLVDNPINVLFTTQSSSKGYAGPKLLERILLAEFIPTMTFHLVSSLEETYYSENCGLEIAFLLDYIYHAGIVKKTIRFPELKGTTFSDLPNHLQRKLLNTSFRSVVFEPVKRSR